MKRADLFGSRCYDKTLVDQSFIQVHIKVFEDLLIVNEPHVIMLFQVRGTHTVNCIHGAPLKPVNVTRDHLGSLLRVRNEQSDLVLVRELP